MSSFSSNILVLREDAENQWKWTQEIQDQIEDLKREQKILLDLIKKNEEIVKNIKETVDEELKIEWNRITNNTIL